MILIFSTEPTKSTQVKDVVTPALFEFLDFKALKMNGLVFPDALNHFSQRDAESTSHCSGSVKIYAKD